jgi:hypothetical protein
MKYYDSDNNLIHQTPEICHIIYRILYDPTVLHIIPGTHILKPLNLENKKIPKHEPDEKIDNRI